MIVARFQFKEEHAAHFIENAGEGRTMVEVLFMDPMDLVETCREFEPYLVNCTALVDGKIIDLKAMSQA